MPARASARLTYGPMPTGTGAVAIITDTIWDNTGTGRTTQLGPVTQGAGGPNEWEAATTGERSERCEIRVRTRSGHGHLTLQAIIII